MFGLALAPLCVPAQEAAQNASARVELGGILVTAEKREARLQDVPVPVTALSGDVLLGNNQVRLQEYFASAPGVSFNGDGKGEARLAIRGLGTGRGGVPTVALTLDDIPLGTSSTSSSNQAYAPDIDPGDLQRVEVLRGPQGTLYGAASLGGLVKYVTLDPSTAGVSGRIQVDLNSVHNGNRLGSGLRGSVNLPISETMAVRASGFARREAGYIDDPALPNDGVNQAEAYGGRLSALWRPSDSLSIKAAAQTQDWNTDGTGFAQVLPGLGDLQQTLMRGTGRYTVRMRIYTATVNAKLGDVDLTSASGYATQAITGVGDINGTLPASITGPTGDTRSTKTIKKTQEIRLTSSIGEKFDWLVGGFYTHEGNNPRNANFTWDPVTGQPVSNLNYAHYPNTFAEYAGFADFTVHFTERFDVQIGGRWSHYNQKYDRMDVGPAVPVLFRRPSPLITPTTRISDDAFTYLFTPRFRFSSDLMAYARVASGYRPGGSNPKAYAADYPDAYEPDKTVNYELGIKGEALDRKISFDASVYYIDWSDIQLPLIEPSSRRLYQVNASNAKSQGVELSGRLYPTDGLTIAGWISYNDAVLTSNLPAPPPAFGLEGDRLPYSSRVSGNLSIEQEVPLGGQVTGFVRGAAAYVGERKADFAPSATAPRLIFPSYVQADLFLGVKYQSWSFNGFVTNVADERGLLSRPTYAPGRFGYVYIQPRTVGLTLARTF